MAGSFVILHGSTKILKQSNIPAFSVTEGLKVIAGFSSSSSSSSSSCGGGVLPPCWLDLVRWSWFGGLSGFNLAVIPSSLFLASRAHLCGFSQPLSLSIWQSVQVHV